MLAAVASSLHRVLAFSAARLSHADTNCMMCSPCHSHTMLTCRGSHAKALDQSHSDRWKSLCVKHRSVPDATWYLASAVRQPRKGLVFRVLLALHLRPARPTCMSELSSQQQSNHGADSGRDLGVSAEATHTIAAGHALIALAGHWPTLAGHRPTCNCIWCTCSV